VGSQLVCSGGHDGTVRAWRVETGEQFAVLEAFAPLVQANKALKTSRSWVRCLAGNAEGAVAIGYQDGALRLWQPGTGQVTWDIVAHTKAVLCAVLTPSAVYTGSADGTIRGWSLSSGDLIDRFTGHVGEVRALRVIGERLVSGGTDQTVRTWDLVSGLAVACLEGAPHCCNFLAGDETRLFVGTLDPELGSWDVKLASMVPSRGTLSTASLLQDETLYLGRSDGTVIALRCGPPLLPPAPEREEERPRIPPRLLKLAGPVDANCWGKATQTGKISLVEEKAARSESEKEAARAEREATQSVMAELESMLEASLGELKAVKRELAASKVMVEELEGSIEHEAEERSFAEMQKSVAEEELLRTKRAVQESQACAQTHALEASDQASSLRGEVDRLNQELASVSSSRCELAEEVKTLRSSNISTEIDLARRDKEAQDQTAWRKMAAGCLARRNGTTLERAMVAMAEERSLTAFLGSPAAPTEVPTKVQMPKLPPAPAPVAAKRAPVGVEEASVEAEQRRLRQSDEEERRERPAVQALGPERSSIIKENQRNKLASSVVAGAFLGREKPAEPAAGASSPGVSSLVYKMGLDAVGNDLLEHHGFTDPGVLAKWEFKWSEDSTELHGPYNSEEIMAWADDGYFEEGLWIRKNGKEEGQPHGEWVPWFDVLVQDEV